MVEDPFAIPQELLITWALAFRTAGWIMFAETSLLQPFEPVIVALYTPAGTFVRELLV
jgi:hypothetical protein